jgi:hypothetical protein
MRWRSHQAEPRREMEARKGRGEEGAKCASLKLGSENNHKAATWERSHSRDHQVEGAGVIDAVVA